MPSIVLLSIVIAEVGYSQSSFLSHRSLGPGKRGCWKASADYCQWGWCNNFQAGVKKIQDWALKFCNIPSCGWNPSLYWSIVYTSEQSFLAFWRIPQFSGCCCNSMPWWFERWHRHQRKRICTSSFLLQNNAVGILVVSGEMVLFQFQLQHFFLSISCFETRTGNSFFNPVLRDENWVSEPGYSAPRLKPTCSLLWVLM